VLRPPALVQRPLLRIGAQPVRTLFRQQYFAVDSLALHPPGLKPAILDHRHTLLEKRHLCQSAPIG
jgi:hypothetical protein